MTKLPPELEKLRDEGAYNFPRSGCEGAFSDGFDMCYEAMQAQNATDGDELTIAYMLGLEKGKDTERARCICGEINARNCPVHQATILPDDLKYCPSLDDQRADFQAGIEKIRSQGFVETKKGDPWLSFQSPADKRDNEQADAWVTRTGNIGTTARQMFIDGIHAERARQQMKITGVKVAIKRRLASDETCGLPFDEDLAETLAKLEEHE